MNFAVVRNETRDRYNEVLILLNHISSLEPSVPTDLPSAEVKILRGLAFVHIYAAFEKSINELVQKTLIGVSALNVQNNHCILPFSAISANNRLRSFKDCSYRSFYPKASELFDAITSKDTVIIQETIFSNDLQNVWYKTIVEVRKTFGMKPLILNPRVRATVDEVVDKRNAIAHGRETTIVVGSNFDSTQIRDKLTIVQEFNDLLIDEFESYLINRRFIKSAVRKKY